MAKTNSKKEWKTIARDVLDVLTKDNVAIVSAGVAFFLYLSIFPGIASVIAIYGLITDPEQVSQQVEQISSILPEQTEEFITQQVRMLASTPRQTLGIGAIFSILLGLWSANNGTRALFKGVILAYDEKSNRDFLHSTAVTLSFTLSGIVLVLISIAIIAGFPTLIRKLQLPGPLESLIQFGRWFVLGLIAYFAFSMVYKFAPLRNNPDFHWMNWGAALGSSLWLLGSGGFSLFVHLFGNLDRMLGSMGAIIILMLWFLLSSFCILLGAELNSELEN